MKPKRGSALPSFVSIAVIPLLSTCAFSQNLFWAVEINESGNRDGTWNTTTPSWSTGPDGPATITWRNTPFGSANFADSPGGTVNVDSPIQLRSINASTTSPVILSGGGMMRFTAFSSIAVDNAPLIIQTPIYNTSSLLKTGEGLLEIRGPGNIGALTINQGRLSLSGNNLADSTNVTNSSALIMIGNDTVANYTQTAGVLTGSSTLSVANMAVLEGGSIEGSLMGKTTISGDVDVSGFIGGDALDVTAGTLTLNGTSTHSLISIASGAKLVNASGMLDAAETRISNLGTLTMSANDTIHDYVQGVGGVLAGNGILTVDKAAFLDGGHVKGALRGGTITRGNVLVSGSLGGGDLNVRAGTLSLEGASLNQTVNIDFGATLADGGGLSDHAGVHNAGTLTVMNDDLIDTYSQSGSALLNGFGTLTAGRGAGLYGGTVAGNLAADEIHSQGNVIVTGSIRGDSLVIAMGELTLDGKSTHKTVDITTSGLFSSFLVNGELAGSPIITNQGNLTMNRNNMVAGYEQSGLGMLDGTATLSTVNGAILSGGWVTGNLAGDTRVRGDVQIPGNIGGGILDVASGTLMLSGTSTNSQVTVRNGANLISNGGFSDIANFTVEGYWEAGMETISTLNIRGTGEISADSEITATAGAAFHGGGVFGKLNANITSDDYVVASGVLTGTNLSVRSGLFWLSGTSTHSAVDIDSGATLLNSGALNPNAVVRNAGSYDGAGDSQVIGGLINSGEISGSPLTVANQTIFNGGRLHGTLHALGGAELHHGTVIEGELFGNVTASGGVDVPGALGGGDLRIENGILNLTGISTNAVITILGDASLKNTGSIGDTSHIINAGTLSVTTAETIGSLANEGGLLDGEGHLIVSGPVVFNGGELAGKLTANSGAILNHGSLIRGELFGPIRTNGDVTISGKTTGNLHIDGGTLTLTGSVDSFVHVRDGISLIGNGRIKGDVLNEGSLLTLAEGDRTLKIDGSLANHGLVSMSVTDAANHDQIKVGGIASLGGNLIVTNNGEGLDACEVARLIDADTFSGEFEGFQSVGFDNGVLFDDTTGRLVGMGGGQSGSASRYLNLNESQTDVYFSLYEDSVEIGERNVTISGNTVPKDKTRDAQASGAGDSVAFTSGLSNGDALLVDALNAATFTVPGEIQTPVINRLSPEVHRGMADYTGQALRAQVRAGVEATPVSRVGRTQIFAVAHTTADGVDSDVTEAGYDLQINGFTTGARYDLNSRVQLGGFFGGDDGSVEGNLIDTEAQGLHLGAFGRYLAHQETDTTLTASLAFGGCDFDVERRSFGGSVTADNVGSDVFEFMFGARTTAYRKGGFRILPNATLRYLSGHVEGFTEAGTGVPLNVGGQDIESLMIELGVDAEYKVLEQLTLTGNLGYFSDFRNSGESLDASFAASGAQGRPFEVGAPGIDQDGITLGLGACYDFDETMRASIGYRGDFRQAADDAHSFNLGMSFGF